MSNPAPPQLTLPSFQPVRRAPDPSKEGGPFVQYVGQASHRRIRGHQWDRHFKGDKSRQKEEGATHTWSIANKKLIPCSEFTDHQLDYLLCDDMQRRGGHSFLKVNYDEEGNLVQVHD